MPVVRYMHSIPGTLLAIPFSVAADSLVLRCVLMPLRAELRCRFLAFPTNEAPSSHLACVLRVSNKFMPVLFDVVPVRVALAAPPMAVWAVVRVLVVVGVSSRASEDHHCGA